MDPRQNESDRPRSVRSVFGPRVTLLDVPDPGPGGRRFDGDLSAFDRVVSITFADPSDVAN